MKRMGFAAIPDRPHYWLADARAQVSWVGGDLQKRFGGGAEEDAINQALVLERQRRDQLGQGEDHMEVLHRQHLSGTRFEPSRPGLSAALGAMAIAAGAV